MTVVATTDVVILGAGLSGLRAADLLSQKGRRVVVVEARDRVGGRTLSVEFDGAMRDIGGQWIGVQHDRLEALTKELGIRVLPQYAEGYKVLDLDGEIRRYKGTIPKLGLLQLLELDWTLRRVRGVERSVTMENPMAAPLAAELDATTVEAWAQSNIRSRAVRDLLRAGTRVVFGAELSEISMLYFLAYARASGGLMTLFENRGGTQHAFFAEGAQEIAKRVAARVFAREGAELVTSAPVDRVEQSADGVIVTSGDRAWRAARCVVAIPPSLHSTIRFEPMLPVAHEQRAMRSPMGGIVKVLVAYDRPFWREAGLSGDAVSDRSVVTTTMDTTHGDRAALVAFVVGNAARDWSLRDPKERKASVVAALAHFFGDAAKTPRDYLEQDWTQERFTRGCPVSVLGAGALSTIGAALRGPFGRIHFAGTETARVATGYLEGALEAAERVAGEVAS